MEIAFIIDVKNNIIHYGDKDKLLITILMNDDNELAQSCLNIIDYFTQLDFTEYIAFIPATAAGLLEKIDKGKIFPLALFSVKYGGP